MTATTPPDDSPDPTLGLAPVHSRYAYVVALLVLVGIDLGALVVHSDAGTLTRVAHLLMPLVGIAALIVMGVARDAATRFAATVAPLVGATLLLRLGLLLFASGSETIRPPDASFVLVYVLAFLGYGRARAAAGSALLAGSAFVLVALGIAVIPGPAAAEHGWATLEALTLHAAVITVLLVLTAGHHRTGPAPTPGPTGATIVAGTDELTGLTSYARLTEALDRELARSERHLLPLSVILIGLDDLQAINDRHGQRAGDNVLVEVSSVLAGVLRGVDTVGRWGGDEFLVIAPTTGPDDAQSLAMRCRYKLRHHPMPEVGPVTASFGVATFEIGDDSSSLVERATDALAEAKAAGRDRVETTSLETRIAAEARRRSDTGT